MDLSLAIAEIATSEDSPVGGLPMPTPAEEFGTKAATCDACSCNVSRCSGTVCCL